MEISRPGINWKPPTMSARMWGRWRKVSKVPKVPKVPKASHPNRGFPSSPLCASDCHQRKKLLKRCAESRLQVGFEHPRLKHREKKLPSNQNGTDSESRPMFGFKGQGLRAKG